MTDIKKGDLVKATNGERVVIGRAHEVRGDWLDVEDFSTLDPLSEWDIEVLDRPLPPIDEELLNNAINAWRKGYYGYGPTLDAARDPQYRKAITAVINYLREHDTYNKENSK